MGPRSTRMGIESIDIALRDLADEHYGAPILEPLGTYRPTTSDARARRPTTELA